MKCNRCSWEIENSYIIALDKIYCYFCFNPHTDGQDYCKVNINGNITSMCYESTKNKGIIK